jgi:hypothetical protein
MPWNANPKWLSSREISVALIDKNVPQFTIVELQGVPKASYLLYHGMPVYQNSQSRGANRELRG